jgi:hypothetical protein
MPEKEYQRLTRARSRSAFGAVSVSRSSLWLGKDHLLGIDSSGYTESYKRFYFRDIQAVTVVATKRRTVWNGALLVPMVICLAGLANALFSLPRKEGAVIVTWVIFAAVFAVPLLINNLLGPTCTCYLRTAVQIEELPSLSRVRRARKVLDRVRPFIIAVQGELPPEEIPARMQSAAGSTADLAMTPGGAAPAADNPDVPPRLS